MSDPVPPPVPPMPLRHATGEHARLYLDGQDATRLLLEFGAIRENTTKILEAIKDDRVRFARNEADAAHEKNLTALAFTKVFDRLDVIEARGSASRVRRALVHIALMLGSSGVTLAASSALHRYL